MSEIAPDPKIVERLERLIREVILRGPNGLLPANSEIAKDIFNIKKKWNYDKWNLLREEIAGSVAALGYNRYGQVPWIKSRRKFSDKNGELSQLVFNAFSKSHPPRFVSDMTVDAKILFYYLHFGSGSEGPLPELMLKTYEAGGFPCGWVGKYPKGNLVVYWPYDAEPQFAEA